MQYTVQQFEIDGDFNNDQTCQNVVTRKYKLCESGYCDIKYEGNKTYYRKKQELDRDYLPNGTTYRCLAYKNLKYLTDDYYSGLKSYKVEDKVFNYGDHRIIERKKTSLGKTRVSTKQFILECDE